jgi:hypothetical protein
MFVANEKPLLREKDPLQFVWTGTDLVLVLSIYQGHNCLKKNCWTIVPLIIHGLDSIQFKRIREDPSLVEKKPY